MSSSPVLPKVSIGIDSLIVVGRVPSVTSVRVLSTPSTEISRKCHRYGIFRRSVASVRIVTAVVLGPMHSASALRPHLTFTSVLSVSVFVGTVPRVCLLSDGYYILCILPTVTGLMSAVSITVRRLVPTSIVAPGTTSSRL